MKLLPLIILTLALCALVPGSELRSAELPNMVLIMCDDLGWGDVGFNGGQVIKTPHLDEMATNSLKFTRFYAAAPVCSPTRGSVVTGRHPYRYGIYTANTGHLKKDEFTLYEALKSRGYRTGHFGKWHMGTLTTRIKDANRGKPGDAKNYSAPWHHQVDRCLVTESKTPTYDPMVYPKNRGSKKNGWFPVGGGDEVEIYGTHYWTGEDQFIPIDSEKLQGDDSKIIMNEAIGFIENSVKKENPFFGIVWFHAPHLPVVAGPEHTDLYPGVSEYEANYYGCITALDEQVGRLRETLRRLEIAENTMVAFCSDNGPEGREGKAPGSAAQFRGRKRDLYEGGIRVPGLLEWPARISEGRSTDFPCGTVDYFPTIMEAAGFTLPDSERPMDGVSLIPLIDGKMTRRPSPLGFQYAKQIALSDNRYKIHSNDAGKTFALYDLIDDPGESKDLSSEKPEIHQAMIKTVTAWRESCKSSDAGEDYR